MYKNSEGIADPTAGQAMAEIDGERRRKVNRVLNNVENRLHKEELEIEGIQVKDKTTGRRYRRQGP